ncbi:MAG: protease complex subunit PrcB family protein [Peptococcaceae bacterium]|nr:protease complex subunit PrcB family protein [Peptococcaceae bacterium]
MAEFPGHPAADDAAYRLARCYEIKGRFADAVKTMQKARFSPDGDMRYASDGRLVYILDVRMTYDQLKALSLAKLEPPLEAFVNYSLAVKEIRRDDFPQAAARLEEFLKQAPDLINGPGILPWTYLNDYEKYDFRGSVEKQLDEVKKLDGLQAQWKKTKDPADLYALAAAIFHNEMLYYNHLWAGQRQYYNWLGHINATGHGHAPAEMAVFAREMINYNHSLPYFQQVYQDPSSTPELKAKAFYSTGLCYIGLDEWGEDASFAFNLSEIQGKIISTYRQFVKEYPDSSMADDALLALGAYTGDAAYLQKIIEEYPDSDVSGKAKKLTKDMESPYYRPVNQYGWPVPFKITSPADESVPQEIKEWAAANTLQPFTGLKTLSEWSYLLIAAGEKPTAGYSVGVISISGSSDKLKVYYRVDGLAPGQVTAQVITHPSILIRIPANEAAVEFVEENPR